MKWIKKGLLFEPNAKYDWMYAYSQIPYAVEFDDCVRIYFATREKYNNGLCRSYPAFVDVEKNDITKIIRIADKPLLEFGNAGSFDEFGIMPASVIKVSDKFHMYYCGWTRAVSTPHKEEIGLAVSDDGMVFRRIGKGPVIGDTLFEPYLNSYPVAFIDNNVIHMFYHTGIKWINNDGKMEIQYLIRHATSNDGITFVRDNRNIIEQKFDDESQTSPSVFKKDGIYHMLFCYRNSIDFRENKQNSYRIGYAHSKDMRNWIREDNLAGIDTSEEGWDSEMIAYPSVHCINGTYYLLYCGNHFGERGFGYAVLSEY